MGTNYFGRFVQADLQELDGFLPMLARVISTDTRIVEIPEDVSEYNVTVVLRHGNDGDEIPLESYKVPMIEFLSLNLGYDNKNDILYFHRRKNW